MNSSEIEQRLGALEHALENIQSELGQLERKVDGPHQVQVFPHPDSYTQKNLADLETFLVQRFPQLASRLNASIVIPGVTGNGEIGPGNQPMPKNYSGTTRVDPRKREIS